ncbi:MAG: hypothetical protein RR879_06870 [Hydrogenoanaerobacterium sp.]
MDTTRNKAKALLFLIIVCLCLTGCERPFTVFVGLDKSTAAAEFEKMPAGDESVKIVYADDRKIALSNHESFICFDVKESKLSASFILP